MHGFGVSNSVSNSVSDTETLVGLAFLTSMQLARGGRGVHRAPRAPAAAPGARGGGTGPASARARGACAASGYRHPEGQLRQQGLAATPRVHESAPGISEPRWFVFGSRTSTLQSGNLGVALCRQTWHGLSSWSPSPSGNYPEDSRRAPWLKCTWPGGRVGIHQLRRNKLNSYNT